MNNKVFLHIVCLIASLYLYFHAPNKVDYHFNLTCFAVFLIQAVVVLKKDIKRDGIFNFNMLFLLSFFFVTYAFPILIWNTPMFELRGVQKFMNYNVASKCSALCTVAISVYFISYKQFYNKSYSLGRKIRASNLSLAVFIYYVTVTAMLYITLSYMRNVGGIAVDVGQWYTVYLASLTLSLIYNCERCKVRCLSEFIYKNAHILVPAIILIVLFVIIGDRGLVMISSIIIAGVYGYQVKRIKTRYLIIGMLLGSVLMYSLKVTRTTENSLLNGDTSAFIDASSESLQEANFITYFADLTQIHRELYIGYDYWEQEGLLEPMQFVIIPFTPFPYVPTLMAKILFGKPVVDLSTPPTLNKYMEYSGYGHFGTHCVIDVFMRFGLVGVVLVFYLWGYLVAVIGASKKKSVTGFAIFIILLASAIRLPRAPLLDITRIFFWVFLIVWLSGKSSPQGKRLR